MSYADTEAHIWPIIVPNCTFSTYGLDCSCSFHGKFNFAAFLLTLTRSSLQVGCRCKIRATLHFQVTTTLLYNNCKRRI